MILLLGATGYIGNAFARELTRRQNNWRAIYHKSALAAIGSIGEIDLVINCAAFIPPESVALCDKYQQATIEGNLMFPSDIAIVCALKEIPVAHISTGCLWSDGLEHSEDDQPQRAFTGHCGFYIGTKVMAEGRVRDHKEHYIWRVRLPFDEFDSPRNYLSKLAKFDEVWDHENSLSHRGDFAKACLDLWEMRAPWGTYNVMNPGSMSASSIVTELVIDGIRKDYPKIVPGAQGGSLVSVKKLLATGVKIRSVEEAIDDSIKNWKTNVSS